jgi:hypothetical protein
MLALNLDLQKLEKEAQYICEKMFNGKKLSQDSVENYVHFNKLNFKTNQEIDINSIVDKKLDIEAIEFYLRLQKRNNVLTQKVHALIYLIEIQKDFYYDFYVKKDSFLVGFTNLVYYTIRSIYKLIKGFMLVRLHGII